MDDKKIRKILISYLKATNIEIRIYQEKSIGSSICDVMAVTDEQKKLDELINDKNEIEKTLLSDNKENTEKIRQIETEIEEIRNNLEIFDGENPNL